MVLRWLVIGLVLANAGAAWLTLWRGPEPLLANQRGRNMVQAAESPTPAFPSNAAARREGDASAELRERVTAELRERARARYERAWASMAPIERIGREATLERVTLAYAELLRELRLGMERTGELTQLLARRETKMIYHVGLPPEVEAAGVPSSFEFGREAANEQIRQEFGSAMLARIEAFEAEIPVREEVAELSASLALTRGAVAPEEMQRLEELVRSAPALPNVPVAISGPERERYLSQRLERLDQITKQARQRLGPEASAALEDYLLEREEVVLGRFAANDRLAQLRRDRGPRAGGGAP